MARVEGGGAGVREGGMGDERSARPGREGVGRDLARGV
jgi:hypothetical protein